MFYEVTNGNYTLGFFLEKEPAEKAKRENNELIKNMLARGITGVDTKEVEIVPHTFNDVESIIIKCLVCSTEIFKSDEIRKCNHITITKTKA